MTRRQIAQLTLLNAVVSLVIAIAVVWASARFGWFGQYGQPTPFVIVPPTATPRPTATATLPASPTPTVQSEEYIVQPGDTLLAIALRLDVDPQLLLDLNQLDNADRLLVGQTLLVPLGSIPSPMPTETPAPNRRETPPPTGPALPSLEITDAVALTTAVLQEAAIPPTATLTVTITAGAAAPILVDVVAPGDLAAEAVLVGNQGGETVQLLNWSLAREDGRRYVFPRLVLLPGAVVVVHSGPGVDSPGHVYWSQQQPVWGEAGTVSLLNQTGEAVATRQISGP